jgi:hypothetical protein
MLVESHSCNHNHKSRTDLTFLTFEADVSRPHPRDATIGSKTAADHGKSRQKERKQLLQDCNYGGSSVFSVSKSQSECVSHFSRFDLETRSESEEAGEGKQKQLQCSCGVASGAKANGKQQRQPEKKKEK